MNGPKASRRFPLRMVPEDKYLLERTVRRTNFLSTSDVVRASVALLKQLWCARKPNNEVIIVNEALGAQYVLVMSSSTAAIPAEWPPEGTTQAKSSIIEVRLSPSDEASIKYLQTEGAGANESQIIRRALAIYAHVVERHHNGYRLAVQTPAGDLVYIDVPGLADSAGDADFASDENTGSASGDPGDQRVALIVDDKSTSAANLADLLERRGYAVLRYRYDVSLGPEGNLVRALEWLEETARTQPPGTPCFVDLCWAVGSVHLAADVWGVTRNNEGEPVASKAGLELIRRARPALEGTLDFIPTTKLIDDLKAKVPDFEPHLLRAGLVSLVTNEKFFTESDLEKVLRN